VDDHVQLGESECHDLKFHASIIRSDPSNAWSPLLVVVLVG